MVESVKKKRIIIDVREAVRNPTGIGTVGRKFIDYLSSHDTGEFEYLILPTPEKWVGKKKKKGFPIFNFLYHIFWKQIYIPFKALFLSADIILSFAPEAYFITKKPTIITAYDMIFFKLPKSQIDKWCRYWRFIVPASMRKAKRIISISESTKNDVVEIAGVAPSKIDVLYLGVNEELNRTSVTDNMPTGPYFMFVGNPEPRRGVENLIDAFKMFIKIYPDYQLFLVGTKDVNHQRIEEKVAYEGLSDNVVFTGFVTSERLHQLYSRASAFIYPSRYEGFGLTVLEAMANGCPVITTNVSSLPEVAGDSAILVTPDKSEELLNAMINIVEDISLREELIKKGYENIKRFSWKSFGDGVLQIVREI